MFGLFGLEIHQQSLELAPADPLSDDGEDHILDPLVEVAEGRVIHLVKCDGLGYFNEVLEFGMVEDVAMPGRDFKILSEVLLAAE